VLEQAAMRSDSQHIEAHHLEEVLRESGIQQVASVGAVPKTQASSGSAASLRPLAEQVAQLERRAIDAALLATKGNKLAAAKLLGISRAKLYERLELSV
jgi:DNA-binding NtrC family response regulator